MRLRKTQTKQSFKGFTRRRFWLAGLVLIAACSGNAATEELADIGAQGGEGEPVAVEGASIERAQDGISFQMAMPTPAPGSYTYPTADMMPSFGSPHPEVSVGGPGEPEAFTVWFIVFNKPDLCTDGICNVDDVAMGAPAEGGVYLGDGRIADDDELVFSGRIILGQEPVTGAPLEDTMGAMIHLLVAPHGKALTGADGWRQLNGPIGNLSLWWPAEFLGS